MQDQIPDSLDEVLTNFTPDAQGENIYPITSITWLLVRTEMDNLDTCTGVANLAHYMITDGQQFAPEQNYVPLPDSLAEQPGPDREDAGRRRAVLHRVEQ